MADEHKKTGDPVVGARIRRERLALGLTQEQVALRADVGQSYISDLESGSVAWSLDSFRRVARALETTPEALTAGPESDMPDKAKKTVEAVMDRLPKSVWKQLGQIEDDAERAQMALELTAFLQARLASRKHSKK